MGFAYPVEGEVLFPKITCCYQKVSFRPHVTPLLSINPLKPLQNGTCLLHIIRVTLEPRGPIRSRIVVFGDNLTKHHYTWSDRTSRLQSYTYSVWNACAILEGSVGGQFAPWNQIWLILKCFWDNFWTGLNTITPKSAKIWHRFGPRITFLKYFS